MNTVSLSPTTLCVATDVEESPVSVPDRVFLLHRGGAWWIQNRSGRSYTALILNPMGRVTRTFRLEPGTHPLVLDAGPGVYRVVIHTPKGWHRMPVIRLP